MKNKLLNIGKFLVSKLTSIFFLEELLQSIFLFEISVGSITFLYKLQVIEFSTCITIFLSSSSVFCFGNPRLTVKNKTYTRIRKSDLVESLILLIIKQKGIVRR